MGGRIAEALIFGADKITTGASSDIKMATDISRRMVTEWGMSDKLGPLTYGENDQEVFLGHSVTTHKNLSDATARVIDEEVRGIVDSAYERARTTLTDNLADLHTLAQGLLEFETLSGDEILGLLRGEKIIRESTSTPEEPGSKPRETGRRASVPSAGAKAQTPPGLGSGPEPLPGA
jgi:cell division protease FtsH